MPKVKKPKGDAPPKKKQVSGEAPPAPTPKPDAKIKSDAAPGVGTSGKAQPAATSGSAANQKPQKATGATAEEQKNKPEEMDAERELAEDAAWKRIQQNTFTRWANEHLKTANKHIGSLETDLADGLRLITLIEVLSGKQLGKHNKKPSFRSQKLENCSVALKFLMQDEGIKIVNIDSTDIVDCKLKLILGLIWTLILHYSISMPMWEGEDESQYKGKANATPKQRLLGWVQSKVPDLPIHNFTSDWNDGRAIGALVDAVAPGLCPDWEDWDPKNALKNAQEAMELANKWLGIPDLIKPEELVNPNVDEMSMMTYLSQFPKAKLKPGAPLRPRTNAKKVRAYGPGIEPAGVLAAAPTNFTIETFSAGKGDVAVDVVNPSNQKEPVDIKYNDDKGKTYTATYTPKLEGPHKVKVHFAGKEIPKSPFPVEVKGFAGDPKKVTVSGPGLEPTGVVASAPTYFDVNTKAAGLGNAEVIILDPEGSQTAVPCKVTKTADGLFRCEYTPVAPGMHSVNVYFVGRPIPKSPFGVKVKSACDAKKVRATGRGLQANGVRVSDAADIKIFTEGAGDADVEVKVIAPDGQPIPVDLKKSANNIHDCIYRPKVPGRHVVMISYGGEQIPKSPYEINVGPFKESKIHAFGPGLHGGMVGKPANFTVETNGETGSLGFAIEGPSQTKIDCKDNGDGSADVTYYPTLPGEYAIHVLCDKEDIPKSPFMANIVDANPKVFPDKVEAYGPGLEKSGVALNKETEFTVDTKKAGEPAPLDVSVMDGWYKPVPVQVKDNKNGTFKCTYKPVNPSKHTVQVSYANQAIPKSPYRINIDAPSDASKVKVFGPGVENDVKSQVPTHFNIDCTQAGPGDVEVTLTNEKGDEIPYSIQDNQDGTHLVEYTAPAPGKYKVKTMFAGKELPSSPINVDVKSNIDVSKVKVDGLEPSAPINSLQQFRVITKDAGPKGPADLGVTITSPTGKVIHGHIVPTAEGFLVNFTPTELGEYLLGISYGREPISPAPYKMLCTPAAPSDSDKVKAYGPGLTGGQVNKPAEFSIDTREAKTLGGLGVTIEGPSEAAIDCKDNGDGTCAVAYYPKEVGDYKVNVTYDRKHIKGSPFAAKVVPGEAEIVPKQAAAPVSAAPNKKVQPAANQAQAQPQGAKPNKPGAQAPASGTQPPAPGTQPPAPGAQPTAPATKDGKKPVDTGKIKVSGNGIQPQGVFKDSPTDFTVDAQSITSKGEGQVTCTITNPSGNKTGSTIQNLNNGNYKVCYTPFEEGPHTIQITYDGIPIPGSPFKVNVTKGCDPSKCKAFGPGLEKGITNVINTFTIETKGAGIGGLGLSVEGPSEAEMNCIDNHDGSCSVEYVPSEKGDYEIGVKYADQDIPGSPFKVPVDHVVDPTKVTAQGPGVEDNHCRENVPQQFTIDATKSGKAPVDVQVMSDKGPIPTKPTVKDNGDGTYDVTYQPPPVGSKCDVKISHAGKDIPKSPFQMKVKPQAEPSNVKVSGNGVSNEPIPASFPVDVIVDTKTAGFGDLDVAVLGPEGDPKKAKVIDNGDGTFKSTYVPDDVGEYKVDVKFAGKDVPNSPFKVKAVPTGQADKCKITETIKETLTVGEEYCITVDTKGAGPGAVTCNIKSSEPETKPSGAPGQAANKPLPGQPGSKQPALQQPENTDISIEENEDGTVSIYYKVKESGDYNVDVKFGGQKVPGGTHKIKTRTMTTEKIIQEEEVTIVESTTSKTYSSVTQSITGSSTEEFTPFELNNILAPAPGGSLTAEVKMPSGNVDHPKIVDNKDGTVSVAFHPKEEGHHEMAIKFNHEHVAGSPFAFHVDKLKSGYVTAHGSGLTHGVCGEPCNFTITTKDAGAAGGLSLAVEGPSKAQITCKDNKDGTVSVSYLPTAPGEYKVSVKFAEKHIRGSPYTPKITGEGRKRNQISVGHSSEVSLKVTEKDIKNLNASIIAPSGLEEPCFVKKLPNGHLGISFTPREKGEHCVNVKRMGNHIPKSPFKIQVGEAQIGDASKVTVSGNALKEGKTHQLNEFSINTMHAGYGGLSLSVEGPSKADIQCKDNENGTLDVSYKPTEPGYYIINLKFADHHVPKSPFTVKVTGEGSGSQTERIKRDRDAVPLTEVGSECKFTFRLPGTTPYDLIARVTSPNGTTEDAEIIDLNDCTYAVHFVPKELGVHTISIRHKDIHIPGSPFQFTVGPLKEGGSHKVHAGGPGLERGEIKRTCEFNVWTREAGAGHLAISVEGPSKAEIDFQDRKDGSCYVTYAVTEPGEYRVGIKFNDQHIPDSPYKVYVTPSMGDANKVVIGNLPENDLHANKPVSFMVHMNGAKGQPDGQVIGPSGEEDDCFVSPVDDEQYALRFVPKMNGVHNIHLKLAGAHIPESPLRLRVGKDEADPAVVHAFGNGLTGIQTGHKTDFIVDTCNAGSGTLAVTIDGPSKVAMDCTEVADGYKVRYTPLAPGEYFVTVKYSGYHIAGSPFRVPCSGKAVAESSVGESSSVVVETHVKESKFKSAGIVLPKFKSDASRVTCKGLGLKKSYLNKQNQFSVNCADAGNNMLYVSIFGPKIPVEECYVKHVGNHSFNVSYLAKERGEHFIVVKYGDDNIPGSPFKVDVM